VPLLVTSTDIEVHTTAFKNPVFQNDAPWGLSRISLTAAVPTPFPNGLNFLYQFDESAGRGTEAYIIDTGCNPVHSELVGRATFISTVGPGRVGVDTNGREYLYFVP
jgi:cerevisin